MKPFMVGDYVHMTQEFHEHWDSDAVYAIITEVWNSTTPNSSSIDSLPRIVATIFRNDGSSYSSLVFYTEICLA
ncbi:MAG: hypothetical protein EBU08_16845 [Micrococcales bacterium]|jgi:hypothetical protein|nr:hypothetical protein [Micrococcales bacterium]